MSKFRAVFTFTDGDTREQDYDSKELSRFEGFGMTDVVNEDVEKAAYKIGRVCVFRFPDDKGGVTVYLKYQVAKIHVFKLPEEQTT